MTRSADELVTDFCGRWTSPDPRELAGFFTEDAVYHNIPLPAVQGRAAIEEYIRDFLGNFEHLEFRVHRQVSMGDLVMNERTDVMRRPGGADIELPVMGVFEIADGRIAAWRDYFDMATITNAFS
ncbi:limonene-1,2-epoxide hydrolase family protein [Mycolicibacterium arseniciresistens]|uniref:Limonene-1,2-epoxide hydrolase family protein n=1 Tax=Mycolicibacterium arseniciresistens TaxID=3062257 RepID=A0ABT8UPC1_9MYCO|nr:limonene-1,2-epoxide hydrolase family protein [Mycolicibacterium arseniciresistens]MDO3639632.1 limonene-1,2-epoxide hydrolase family protein [Mycolicibacterium arseniciresistens]